MILYMDQTLSTNLIMLHIHQDRQNGYTKFNVYEVTITPYSILLKLLLVDILEVPLHCKLNFTITYSHSLKLNC